MVLHQGSIWDMNEEWLGDQAILSSFQFPALGWHVFHMILFLVTQPSYTFFLELLPACALSLMVGWEGRLDDYVFMSLFVKYLNLFSCFI